MLKPLAEISKARKLVMVIFGCTMLNASCLDKLDTKGSIDLYKKAIEDPFVIVALDTIKSLTSGKDLGFFKLQSKGRDGHYLKNDLELLVPK